MKKISLIFILLCIIILFSGCASFFPTLPTNGIWYNDELKLAIEFGEGEKEDFVYSYDDNLSDFKLEFLCYQGGGPIEIRGKDASGEEIELYRATSRYTKNEFIIYLYSKADPANNYKTQLELNDEKYVFTQISSYDEISESKVN